MDDTKKTFQTRSKAMTFVTFGLMILFAVVSVSATFGQEAAAPAAAAISPEQAKVLQFGLIAAALAFGFGAIGAGIAIANVGAAAMGAIGERPEIASQALIFIALAEGLVIFGFITALMILGKI